MRAASQQHMDDKLVVLSRAARICRQDLFTSEPVFKEHFLWVVVLIHQQNHCLSC